MQEGESIASDVRRRMMEIFGSFEEFHQRVRHNSIKNGVRIIKMAGTPSTSTAASSSPGVQTTLCLQSMMNLVNEPPLTALPPVMPFLSVAKKERTYQSSTPSSSSGADLRAEESKNRKRKERESEIPEQTQKKSKVENDDITPKAADVERNGARSSQPLSTAHNRREKNGAISPDSGVHSTGNDIGDENQTVEEMLKSMKLLQKQPLSPIPVDFIQRCKLREQEEETRKRKLEEEKAENERRRKKDVKPKMESNGVFHDDASSATTSPSASVHSTPRIARLLSPVARPLSPIAPLKKEKEKEKEEFAPHLKSSRMSSVRSTPSSTNSSQTTNGSFKLNGVMEEKISSLVSLARKNGCLVEDEETVAAEKAKAESARKIEKIEKEKEAEKAKDERRKKRDQEREKEREKEKGRDREKERERAKEKEKEKEKEREKEKAKEKEREREKEMKREKEKERQREKEKDRDREREREKKRKEESEEKRKKEERRKEEAVKVEMVTPRVDQVRNSSLRPPSTSNSAMTTPTAGTAGASRPGSSMSSNTNEINSVFANVISNTAISRSQNSTPKQERPESRASAAPPGTSASSSSAQNQASTTFKCLWKTSKMTSGKRVPIPDPTAPNPQSKVDFYHGLAKEFKAKADKATGRVEKVLDYMISSLYFVIESTAKYDRERSSQSRAQCAIMYRETQELLRTVLNNAMRPSDDPVVMHMIPRIKILGQTMLAVMNYQIYVFKSEQVSKSIQFLMSREAADLVEPVPSSTPSSSSTASNKSIVGLQKGGTTNSASSTPNASQPPKSAYLTSLMESNTMMVQMPGAMYELIKQQLKISQSLVMANKYWKEAKDLSRNVDWDFLKNVETVCAKTLSIDSSFDTLGQIVLTAVASLQAEMEDEAKSGIKPRYSKVKPLFDVAMKIGNFSSQIDRPTSRISSVSNATTPIPPTPPTKPAK